MQKREIAPENKNKQCKIFTIRVGWIVSFVETIYNRTQISEWLRLRKVMCLSNHITPYTVTHVTTYIYMPYLFFNWQKSNI